MNGRGGFRALVIGAGGLGCPTLWKLGAGGSFVEIEVWDPDRLEVSNLHRQILFRDAEVGLPKAELAAAWMAQRYPGARTTGVARAFTRAEADRVADFDVVFDCVDLYEIKLMLNELCARRRVPLVVAAASSWSGMVLPVDPTALDSPCLRCVFDEGLAPGAAPTCDQVGIFGPLLGRVAAAQVDAALALLRGECGPLTLFERGDQISLHAQRRADCAACGAQPRHTRRAPEIFDFDAPVLSLLGMQCPRTFVETRRRLERMPPGGRLWVEFSGDESARTVPASAVAAGHRVLARDTDGAVHRVLLERGA